MKTFITNLLDFSQDKFLRNDEKFFSFFTSNKWDVFEESTKSEREFIPLRDVLTEDYHLCTYSDYDEYKGIPTGQQYIDEDGDIISYDLVTEDNHPARLKYTIEANNIVLSSLRLAKSPAFMFHSKDLNQYVFSNGFYVFKVIDTSKWNPRFVCYLLRHSSLKNLLDNNLYRGIGISSYKASDLLNLKIRRINLEEQEKALCKIKPLEEKISALKAQRKTKIEIANDIFTREFNIDTEKLYSIASKRYTSTNLSSLCLNNTNVRTSYRWDKAQKIQDELRHEVNCCQLLGRFIVSTNNGKSPSAVEEETDTCVLGINSINSTGDLSFDAPKYYKDPTIDLEKYSVHQGDFFVSRGNTVDLVAMASISLKEPEVTTIYPDLMIKTVFSEDINLKYAALIFNSYIGRLYFKYVTKGKNQTMVKVSPKELKEFWMPIPSIQEQERIVEEIQAELDKQAQIAKAITELRREIESIIKSTISA